ncbi:MAG: aminotransferase class I/II-fold pyridoxal phosphate-dependent enzyme, partial [Candidatus Latescibacteria bacterium]|nr:aminotransferase class I/II-fold pyridoxal phosphate-dependent enzyme [Candidatus Latescibacterota bacterium]
MPRELRQRAGRPRRPGEEGDVPFGPVPFMRWAKEVYEADGIHFLAGSGIYGLLEEADLDLDRIAPRVWLKNSFGLPALRKAIAARHGVRPEQVLTAEGASGANFLILAAWIRPGDPVLLEEPYYDSFGTLLAGLQARIVRVPVDGDAGHEAILEAVRSRRGARPRAVIVTNPHNPTGRPLADSLLRSLAERCAETGALLLVDEAYRDFLFEETPGTAYREGMPVVSTASLTKGFGLGVLRIGWAIGPEELIDRAIRIHDNFGVVHPALTEAIGAAILSDAGRLAGWRERVRARVAANREHLARFL